MLTEQLTMISTNEALEIVRTNQPAPRTETATLAGAHGKVLAADIAAPEPSPRYTNSAMDGFAVRWEDVRGAGEKNPAVVTVVGESRAGVPHRGAVGPGQTVRISTGAMMPDGADSVIPVEDTRVDGDSVSILSVSEAGRHVRVEGEEFEKGTVVLEKGTALNSPQIALLTALGMEEMPVYAAPRISVLVTGTELVPHDRPPEPWQIRDSNGPMLAAAVEQSRGDVVQREWAPDDLESLTRLIEDAARCCDVIMISGGVSVGPHDHVKEAARLAGFSALFWKVRQKPGKPLFVARKDDCILFGLPGNPVSAFVCYAHYVHPVLRNLAGLGFGRRSVTGRLAAHVRNSGRRAQFLQVRLTWGSDPVPGVEVMERQNSHMITTTASADGFLLIDPGGTLEQGELVEVLPFPWMS
jgi:molybdopterin molybdotransferase